MSTADLNTAEALSGAREYLKSVAIAVEAAGTLDRAVELGLIGGEDTAVMASGVRDVIPPSRGGDSCDPEADDKWSTLLATALLERGFDRLDELRSLVQMLEAQRRPKRPQQEVVVQYSRLNAVEV